jgi:hypothetical protein
MRRITVTGSALALTLAATACQDVTTAPSWFAPTTTAADRQVSAGALASVRLERGRLAFPSMARIADGPSADLTRRVINPDDYVCQETTPLIDWYTREVRRFITKEPALFDLLYNQLLADLIPTYQAAYFETNRTPQYFGYDGEFNNVLNRTERDVKRFWDIDARRIQLVAMHGTVLQNVRKTAMTYEFLFGLDSATSYEIAGIVKDAVKQSRVLHGGDHPLFTFNSFAISSDDGSIPEKIVMGDGVLEGYDAIGYGDVAPQAVYAHEFAHHIQFDNGYFNDPYALMGSGAEQTRYTELMADAYAGYYLTHKKGAAMNRRRVQEFLHVFFDIGDCAFDDDGHHGTPNQRMKAAKFGFDVAESAKQKGKVLSSAEFHALFVKEYPKLIAPDAN